MLGWAVQGVLVLSSLVRKGLLAREKPEPCSLGEEGFQAHLGFT